MHVELHDNIRTAEPADAEEFRYSEARISALCDR
jgi:hypothetical protein